MSSTSTNKFTILYFAGAGDHTGKEKEDLSAPLPLRNLFAELEAKHPGINALLQSCLVTINLDYVDMPPKEDVVIQPGDEVAIIPPVSSG